MSWVLHSAFTCCKGAWCISLFWSWVNWLFILSLCVQECPLVTLRGRSTPKLRRRCWTWFLPCREEIRSGLSSGRWASDGGSETLTRWGGWWRRWDHTNTLAHTQHYLHKRCFWINISIETSNSQSSSWKPPSSTHFRCLQNQDMKWMCQIRETFVICMIESPGN